MKRWIEEHRILATLIPVLLIMGLIFGFSSQNGEESGSLSAAVARFLVQLFAPDFETWTAMQQEEICGAVRLVVRKGAHFTEYFLLGLFLLLHIDAVGRKVSVRLPWLIAWGIGTAYAITDELHQGLVAGRNPAVPDVLIDSAGVIAGALVMLLLLKRKSK